MECFTKGTYWAGFVDLGLPAKFRKKGGVRLMSQVNCVYCGLFVVWKWDGGSHPPKTEKVLGWSMGHITATAGGYPATTCLFGYIRTGFRIPLTHH